MLRGIPMGDVQRQVLKDKEKVKIGIIFLIVMILSIFFVILFGREKRSAEDIIVGNVLKTLTLDTYECVATIEFVDLEAKKSEDPDIQLMLDVIKDMNIKLIHRYNQSSGEVQALIEIYMRDVRLLEGNLYVNNDYLALDVPVLYHQPIYMTWDDFSKEYGVNKEQLKLLSGNIKEKLSRNNFETITEIDAQIYFDIIKDLLKQTLRDKDKEKISLDKEALSCIRYTFQMNEEDMGLFINHFIDSILNDQKLEGMMNRQGLVFLFDNNTYNELKEKYPYSAVIETKMFFDKHDLLRTIEMSIDSEINKLIETPIKSHLSIRIEYTKLNDIIFDSIDVEESINISHLSNREKQELYTEMSHNLIKNLENNKLLDLLMLN